jgi:hypothetical protein
MAGGLATPSASADPPQAAPQQTTKTGDTVKGVFSYDRNASAETIYASLQRKAEKLCTLARIRPAYMRAKLAACIDSVVASGVSRIGRADLAEIHSRQRGQG